MFAPVESRIKLSLPLPEQVMLTAPVPVSLFEFKVKTAKVPFPDLLSPNAGWALITIFPSLRENEKSLKNPPFAGSLKVMVSDGKFRVTFAPVEDLLSTSILRFIWKSVFLEVEYVAGSK
ncbi:MAG: hypothetical protein HYV90_05255 [Candidatus Woesebacteria bacterium]|nr:MAG: hypothetical protein HYV90_05255 [Candidatus Woesebacteria bacterium]